MGEIADEMTMGGTGGLMSTGRVTYQFICRTKGCKYHLEIKRHDKVKFCPMCGVAYGS